MNNAKDNPYSSTSSTSEPNVTDSGEPLGRLAGWFTSTVIICGVAIIVGEVLAFVVLLPPMNRWFHMTGEFDGLILIGMPMWAAGLSFITAIVFGATFPRRHAATIAIAVAFVIVTWFGWSIVKSANRPSDRYSAVTVSAILLTAVIFGVVGASKGLSRINRIRARSAQAPETQRESHGRLRLGVVILTVLWGLIDAAVLIMIFQDSRGFWLMPLSLFGLVFGLGVMAFCAYQSAARSEVRTVARLGLFVLTCGLVATIYLWLQIVWFGSS